MGIKIRRAAAIGAVMAILVAVAGCAQTPARTGPGKVTVLSQWTDGTPEYAILTDVVKSLAKHHIDVKVIPTSGTDIQSVFEASTLAGNEADVVIAPLVDKSTNWVAKGVTVDVGPLLDEWGLTDSIKPDAVKFFKDADGAVRAVPYAGYVWPVWYNMDLLGNAGITKVPSTTGELLADVAALKHAGVTPFVVGGSDWSGQKLFEQIVQSQLSDDEAAKVLSKGNWCATPDAMKGIDEFVSLRDAGLFIDGVAGYTADQMNAAFYGGQVAMMSAGSWAFAATPKGVMGNTVLAGLPIPSHSPHKAPTDYQGWGGAFHISANGQKNKNAVGAFVKAMYDPAILARFASEANSFPAGELPGDTDIAQPLMKQAVGLGHGVANLIVPDTLVPGAVAQPMIRATSLAYSPGNDSQAICGALDEAYAQ